jgi:hypothetical protein
MIKYKRFIACLCLLSLIGSITACGGGPDNAAIDDEIVYDETTASAEVGNSGDMLSDRSKADDGLGTRDFEGAAVNISINTFCQDGFYQEELTGDVLNDAVYDRNRTIEERFNVKLEYIADDYNKTYTDVLNSVTAGDDDFQIVAEHAIVAGKLVTAELLTDWYDVTNVDFSRPWWSNSNVDNLTIDGVCLLAVGDFALTTIGRTYCMAYDKAAAESYMLPDMYELVYDGGWTFDKLIELTKGTYSDLNMNNERDTDDYYGYSTSVLSKIGAFLWAFNNPIYVKNSSGELELVISTEKINSILEKLVSFCWDNENVYYDVNYKDDSGNPHYASEIKFSVGTTLFASTMLESGIKYFRNTKGDYGIIPYPKWDVNQNDYYTIVDGGFSALAIPKTVAELEMVGTVIEALCAETYRSVIPVYYDKALKEKGTRDEESKEMIDFVISKRVFDFGYVFDGWKGYGFKLEEMVKAKNTNFASMYASTAKAVGKYYGSIIEIFKNAK